MKICQQGMIYRKIGSFTATYSNDQTKYTIFDTKGNEICKFNVDYQKGRPVHENVYRTMFHISKFYLILQAGIGLLTVL